jgi:hypothetical protein
LGASALNRPGGGGGAWACGQADIALSTHCMAHQKCRVSCRWCDEGGSGWGVDVVRLRVRDCAECTSKRESGCKHPPNSRSFYLPIKVVSHLIVFSSPLFDLKCYNRLRLLVYTTAILSLKHFVPFDSEVK